MATQMSIIGIGNALMDIVVKLPNSDILEANNLPKGSMILVDAETSTSINQQTEKFERNLSPGGSVANTIDGLARLGVETAFIGKVGADQFGLNYQTGLESIRVKPVLFKSSTPTGLAMALVTPDAERTFGTYLGAAIELTANDLNIELFKGYNIAYIEGYLVQNHLLVRKAVELARKAGLRIAIDLASYNVVAENLEFLKEIVTEYVDIIFANEEEAKAFTGEAPEVAVEMLGDLCEIAIVKVGSRGSLIRYEEKTIEVGTIGTNCIDTTGAGDLYASGFLFGFSNNYSIEICGQIGAITAGNVITVYGARMDNEMWKNIKQQIKLLGAE